MSLSSRRAWIEMPKREQKLNLMSSRSPHGERGLKYEIIESGAMVQDASLSSRRAWIEIFVVLEHMNMFHIVALLTESVDWNHIYTLSTLKRLCRSPHGERGLKYRLHRNLHQSNQSLSSRRAWIEIEWSDEVIYTVLPSLSSRRAWIEIWGDSGAGKYTYRRSPHGERGLKLILMITQRTEHMSLSSRRAWIEILIASVIVNYLTCRSPHGERGLKLIL